MKLPKLKSSKSNKIKRKKKNINKLPYEVVAIDIGTFALKLVEMQLKPEKVIKKLVYYPWQTPLPHKDIIDIIVSPNFHKEIANILESNNIRCRNIMLLAANSKLVMRPMKFPPNLNDSEINKLLDLQIEEHIPYDENEVYYDYNTVKRDNDETLINLFASEKQYIDELINIFKQLKRRVHSINVSPIAMYNMAIKCHHLNLTNSEIFVTVNIGALVTELCVYKKDELLLYRTIPIAGNKFTNAYAVDQTIVINKAEFNKCELGLETALQYESVLGVQNELFDQLWRSIQYIIAFNKSYSLKRVYLAGGSANLKGLADKFRRYIEIKMQDPGQIRDFDVQIVNPFNNFKLAKNLNILDFSEVASSFAAVMGLMCGGA